MSIGPINNYNQVHLKTQSKNTPSSVKNLSFHKKEKKRQEFNPFKSVGDLIITASIIFVGCLAVNKFGKKKSVEGIIKKDVINKKDRRVDLLDVPTDIISVGLDSHSGS